MGQLNAPELNLPGRELGSDVALVVFTTVFVVKARAVGCESEPAGGRGVAPVGSTHRGSPGKDAVAICFLSQRCAHLLRLQHKAATKSHKKLKTM